MKKIRIRLEDGTFASVPRVAKSVENDEYNWFKDEDRHVYVFPNSSVIGTCGNDVFSREEVGCMVECSVDEFNEVVRKVVEQKYICHEQY